MLIVSTIDGRNVTIRKAATFSYCMRMKETVGLRSNIVKKSF